MNKEQLIKEARALRTRQTDESYRWRSYPVRYAIYMDVIEKAWRRVQRRMELPQDYSTGKVE